MGLIPSRSPNTTSPKKEQGRSKNDTTAPPTVCFPVLSYMDGPRHKASLSGGRKASASCASTRSSASLLFTVQPSRDSAALHTAGSSWSKSIPRWSSASPTPCV